MTTTSWTALQDHMRKNYRLQDDKADMMSMVWSYDDGRSQKIILRKYKAFDHEMVEFKSAFGRRGDADAEEMLVKNAELPLATIALSGDVYVVVYNVLLEHLQFSDFDLYLSRIAAVADTLEEKYGNRDVF